MSPSSASEEALKSLLRSLTSSSPARISPEDVELLAIALSSESTRSERSLAFLCVSKICENAQSIRNPEQELVSTFQAIFDSTFITAEKEEEIKPEVYIPFVNLVTPVFALAPKAAVQLVTLPVGISTEGQGPDALEVLLEAAELPSGLQPALAELLAQAAGSKPGRELVKGRAMGWLRGAVDYGGSGDQGELGVLCAVALSKLGREDVDGQGGDATEDNTVDEDGLCKKMMDHIISTKYSSPSILPTIEGLSILSHRAAIKHRLAHNLPFLKSLLALSPIPFQRGSSLPVIPRGSIDLADTISEPVETSLCFGITTILVNLTTRKPVLSADDEQVAKLRAMAISGKMNMALPNEDLLDSNDAVRERVECVTQAGVVNALHGLARAGSRLVKEGLGRLCLNLVEDKVDRLGFVRDGGMKVLSSIVQSLTAPPRTATTSNSTAMSQVEGDPIAILAAIQALAKMVITTPPNLLFPPPHQTTSLNTLSPLYKLLTDPSSSLLQQFEALMALTNIASIDSSIANRIMAATILNPASSSLFRGSGSHTNEKLRIVSKVEEDMFHDNPMIRRAAIELVCNLVNSPVGFAYFSGEALVGTVGEPNARVRSRLNILLLLTGVDDVNTRLAAGGTLAIVTESKVACRALLTPSSDIQSLSGKKSTRTVWERVCSMFDPEVPELEVELDGDGEEEEQVETIPVISTAEVDPHIVHRAVVILLNLINHTVSLTVEARKNGLREAREAGVEERLMRVLRMSVGRDVLSAAVDALKILKKYSKDIQSF